MFDQTFGGISCLDSHPEDSRRNNCQRFTACGNSFIVLHLEFSPDDDDITWAHNVLQSSQDAIAIITTHGFLDGSGRRDVHAMGSTEYIWDRLVVPNDNVHFVLCGHVHAEYTRTDSVNGRLVHQLLADYQDDSNGGNGWLRIMTFAPNEDKVYVQTYSPWLDQYETDGDSEFVLDLPMSDTVSGYDALGTNYNVTPDTSTSLVWPYDLNLGTAYEWYVTVTGDSTSQNSPVWDFTTTSSNLSVKLQSPVDVTVSQNPVTFTVEASCLVGNLFDASLHLGSPAPVEDAQLTESAPSTPDGENTSINVDGENPHAHALIKFRDIFGDGPDQVPPSTPIESATLEVYCTDAGNTMDLYRVTGDWSEATVTWDTAPGYDSSFSLPGDCSATGSREIPVTEFVQAWSDGQPNYGILLTDTGTQGVDFHSSEGGNPPILTVTYNGNSLQFTAGSTALDWIETIEFSGDTSSETVTFSPYTLEDGEYTWNCLVTTTTDGEACWAPSDAQFVVDTINDAPTARDDAYSVSVNDSLVVSAAGGVLANDSDPEGDCLTAVLTVEPTAGTVTLNANGSFTYTPNAGFTGTDTFLYVADDGELSTEATVRITVEVPVLFSDDFESGGFAAGGWGVTAQASVETTSAHTGTYGALLKKTSSIVKRIDTGGATAVTFTYWARTDGLKSESLSVAWSKDGETWTPLNALTGTTDWAWSSHNISPAQPSFVIRFRIDGNTGNDLAMVDDVMVQAGTATNQPPTADFTCTTSNLSADFADQSSDSDGNITAWTWDFGDGASSTAQNPSHTYASNGTYTVTLTVTDDDAATDTTSQNVTVSTSATNSPPTAAFTYAVSDLTVGFTDQSSDSDGNIKAWTWDFGDGASSTQQNPSHTYATDHTYEVTLTVTDDDNATAADTAMITVTAGSANTVTVSHIEMKKKVAGKNYFAQAVVTVWDQDSPVAGAIVHGYWYFNEVPLGPVVSNGTAGDGSVTLDAPKQQNAGTFRFEVTGVVFGDYTYVSTVTTGSVTVP